MSRNGTPNGNLNNRIALYTGNTFFLWPQLKFSGILRPFGEYQELISIVVVYTFTPDRHERIADIEIIIHETWKIASQSRASATREYIGSVIKIDDLIAGKGKFETAGAFYVYWRHSTRGWKKSPEAERLLCQALDAQS